MKSLSTAFGRILPGAAFAAVLFAGTASAQCPTDDDASTNDDCANAQAIATGATTGLVVTDLSEDFYTFSVPAGQSAVVDVLFLDVNGDIDLRLFDDNGTCANQIDTSGSVTDNEQVEVTNCGASAATYTLRVFLFSGTCNDYSVNITINGPSCPGGDDALEPNDSLGAATAQALPAVQAGLVSLSCNDDWFSFSVANGNDLTVDLAFIDANGNINATLWDATGTTMLDTGLTGTDNEQLTWTNLTGSAATVLLQVVMADAGICNSYDLAASEAPSPCAGPDDSSEDNDTCLTAVAAGTSPLLARYVHKVDEDFYTVVVAAGDILSVDVLFTHANGDVDAQLIDTTNCTTVLDTSGSTTDNEDLMWTNTTGVAATVAIRVYVWSGSASDCNTYDLVWSAAPDPCTTAMDDSFEENDDCSTAAALPMGMTTGLFVRKDNIDDDWYSITVPDQGTLTVDVLFIDANGDIDCRLFDACGGTQVDGSASTTDNEDVTVTNMSGGPITYFLEVYVWGFAAEDCNNYDLNVSVSGGMSNLVPFCFGDGSGTPCNCGNNSAPGHPGGCAHQNGNGSVLTGSGVPSVMADTLHFDLTSSVQNSFAVLSSGNNALPQTGACIGCGLAAANLDGLRCVGGVLARHGSRATNASGATAAGWGPPAGPATGLILQGFTNTGGAAFTAGSTRHFQVFVRTDPLLGCMQGQNTSNGVTVMIMP